MKLSRHLPILAALFAPSAMVTHAPPGRPAHLPRAGVWPCLLRGVAVAVRGYGRRSRLLRIVDYLFLSRGSGGAVEGGRGLPAQRIAAAHHKENLNALRAREVFAQLREGTLHPA